MEFPFYITVQTAVALSVLQGLLMLRVGLYRTKVRVPYGDGGDETLLRRIRAHGNLAENASLVLVLLALAEFSGLGANIVGGFAAFFVIARVVHALAITSGKATPLRVLGALGTVGTQIGLAIVLLLNVVLPSAGI